MVPDVVVPMISRIFGMGSSSKVISGSLVGSANVSDSIMMTVLSVNCCVRDLFMEFASFEYFFEIACIFCFE